MKRIVTIATLLLLANPVIAQRDPLNELDKWSRKEAANRTFRPGEEVWTMLGGRTRSEQKQLGPVLKPREVVLTNADILKMKAAGFGDETILSAINTRQSLFDTAPDALISLKQYGISEAVLNAMMGADSGTRGNLIPLDKNGMPSEIGVYIQGKDRLTEIDAEPISWQSGGAWKSILTGTAGVVGTVLTGFPFVAFMTKGHTNAKAMGARSQYQVDPNGEFIIRTPEGVAPSEYLLVSLEEKDNRREFRLLTGGVVHRSSGAERNTAPFTYRKVAPRTYYATLGNLARGEYGFLPTHLMNNKDAAFVGKLYSFSVD